MLVPERRCAWSGLLNYSTLLTSGTAKSSSISYGNCRTTFPSRSAKYNRDTDSLSECPSAQSMAKGELGSAPITLRTYELFRGLSVVTSRAFVHVPPSSRLFQTAISPPPPQRCGPRSVGPTIRHVPSLSTQMGPVFVVVR